MTDEKKYAHLKQLLSFEERLLAAQDKKLAEIVGTDEVGRGCIAGPVVAAAVLLVPIRDDEELLQKFAKLNDSKKLAASVREVLAEAIRTHCRFALGEASVEEIEELNILKASQLAMKRALSALDVPSPESTLVLVDGNQKLPDISYQQMTVVKGDSKSASIAAASVVAKVHRDALMLRLSDDFPHYAWDSNKGYASETHRTAISERGLSPHHRESFCRNILAKQLSAFG